jgi:hypothetical protein
MRPIRFDTAAGSTSPWIPLDSQIAPFRVLLQCVPAGGANYTVNYTLDDVFGAAFVPGTAVATPIAALTLQTSTKDALLQAPYVAVQVVVSGTGSVRTNILQGLALWPAGAKGSLDYSAFTLARSKIAASIAAASAANPITNDPWTVPPPWQPNTLFNRATCVLGIGAGNTNNIYHCSTTGTTAASVGPVGAINTEINDGTARWIYGGKVRSVGSYPLFSTVIPAAPTDQMDGYLCLLPAASRAALGLTKQWSITFQNQVARWTGGPVVAGLNGTDLEMIGPNESTAASPNRATTSARWCKHFQINARNWLAIAANDGLNPGRNLSIEINGRKLTEYSISIPATAGAILLIDLSKFGPGPKDVRIYGGFVITQQIYTLWTEPEALIWKGAPRNNLKICFEGDSLTQGGSSETTPASELIESVTARLLGIDSWYNNAVGSTGCIQTFSGTRTNYGQRLKDVASENPDIFVIGGFHNDQSFPSAERRVRFLDYYQQARAALPNTFICIEGTQALQGESTTSTVEPSIFNTELDSLFAFNQWGDSNSGFIPLLTDASPFPAQSTAGWFYCSPQGGAVNSHPIFRYNRSIAHKIAEGIKQYFVETNLTGSVL